MSSVLDKKHFVDHPFGFFVDMEKWPQEAVPVGEEDIVLYGGFLRHERGFIVQRDAIFLDPERYFWRIEPGNYCNGISNIRLFWRVIHPYQQCIREAAAFHDVYCTTQIASQKKTHLMFWRIQRANKTKPIMAWFTWLFVRCWCFIRYPFWR